MHIVLQPRYRHPGQVRGEIHGGLKPKDEDLGVIGHLSFWPLI